MDRRGDYSRGPARLFWGGRRETEREHAAFVRRALHLYLSTALLYHAKDHGQPQAGTLGRPLSGVKRLEQVTSDFVAHAAAVVSHLQADQLAPRRLNRGTGVVA